MQEDSSMYQWISEVIKNEYKFVKALKNSELSKVLVYRHKETGRKIIVRHIKDGADVYEKMLELKCDNLPIIYEVVQGDVGAIVMEEYISGMTIGDVLQSGLYTENGVREIIRQVCKGLGMLHYYGIIHRDIKPDNVMISEKGQVKLIDFNASRIYKKDENRDTRILGTTGYAAPEQYGLSQTDPRTDIYALGVLINIMLTGEHPSKVLCKGKFRKIVKKAVNINPDDRYQSCQELMESL